MNGKSKLTSRKWWAAITGVRVSVMVLFTVDSKPAERHKAMLQACTSCTF